MDKFLRLDAIPEKIIVGNHDASLDYSNRNNQIGDANRFLKRYYSEPTISPHYNSAGIADTSHGCILSMGVIDRMNTC